MDHDDRRGRVVSAGSKLPNGIAEKIDELLAKGVGPLSISVRLGIPLSSVRRRMPPEPKRRGRS